MKKPIAGLLPFYLKLYDDTQPRLREAFEPFLKTITERFVEHGINVHRAPICRLRTEFEDALEEMEDVEVDCIVTLHLAYSLSMESIDALADAARPILLLDTTMDFDFGMDVDPARIMFDHGIHGVQDLACMLRRRGVPYEIVAGHATESDVIERAARIIRGACAARAFKSSKVLRIGDSFCGMGDFKVSDDILEERLGIHVDEISPDALIPMVEDVTDAEIEKEKSTDRDRYAVEIADEVHNRSLRLGLGLRKYLKKGGYSACTMNFLAFKSAAPPLETVPFLELSKAMARGMGYAGEGDVLTAALVGALNRAFGRTTFTEIFCPDWKGGALFLSHMGEINPEISGKKPLICEKDFPWTGASNPAVITCAPRPGKAVFANLAPGPEHSFRLIVAPVEILDDTTHPDMLKSVRGWIKPQCPLEDFLERFSRLGGTHHSALVLGNRREALVAFGRYLGLDCQVID